MQRVQSSTTVSIDTLCKLKKEMEQSQGPVSIGRAVSMASPRLTSHHVRHTPQAVPVSNGAEHAHRVHTRMNAGGLARTPVNDQSARQAGNSQTLAASPQFDSRLGTRSPLRAAHDQSVRQAGNSQTPAASTQLDSRLGTHTPPAPWSNRHPSTSRQPQHMSASPMDPRTFTPRQPITQPMPAATPRQAIISSGSAPAPLGSCAPTQRQPPRATNSVNSHSSIPCQNPCTPRLSAAFGTTVKAAAPSRLKSAPITHVPLSPLQRFREGVTCAAPAAQVHLRKEAFPVDGWTLSSDAQLGQLLRDIEPLEEEFEKHALERAVTLPGESRPQFAPVTHPGGSLTLPGPPRGNTKLPWTSLSAPVQEFVGSLIAPSGRSEGGGLGTQMPLPAAVGKVATSASEKQLRGVDLEGEKASMQTQQKFEKCFGKLDFDRAKPANVALLRNIKHKFVDTKDRLEAILPGLEGEPLAKAALSQENFAIEEGAKKMEACQGSVLRKMEASRVSFSQLPDSNADVLGSHELALDVLQQTQHLLEGAVKQLEDVKATRRCSLQEVEEMKKTQAENRSALREVQEHCSSLAESYESHVVVPESPESASNEEAEEMKKKQAENRSALREVQEHCSSLAESYESHVGVPESPENASNEEVTIRQLRRCSGTPELEKAEAVLQCFESERIAKTALSQEQLAIDEEEEDKEDEEEEAKKIEGNQGTVLCDLEAHLASLAQVHEAHTVVLTSHKIAVEDDLIAKKQTQQKLEDRAIGPIISFMAEEPEAETDAEETMLHEIRAGEEAMQEKHAENQSLLREVEERCASSANTQESHAVALESHEVALNKEVTIGHQTQQKLEDALGQLELEQAANGAFLREVSGSSVSSTPSDPSADDCDSNADSDADKDSDSVSSRSSQSSQNSSSDTSSQSSLSSHASSDSSSSDEDLGDFRPSESVEFTNNLPHDAAAKDCAERTPSAKAPGWQTPLPFPLPPCWTLEPISEDEECESEKEEKDGTKWKKYEDFQRVNVLLLEESRIVEKFRSMREGLEDEVRDKDLSQVAEMAEKQAKVVARKKECQEKGEAEKLQTNADRSGSNDREKDRAASLPMMRQRRSLAGCVARLC